MGENILIGKGTEQVYLKSSKLNHHGFITGATGSGKTTTMKIIAEKLSSLGIPVILSDVKGDLTGLGNRIEINDKINERIQEIGITDFEPTKYPLNICDIYRESGIPIRITVSELGPLMISEILELNDTQASLMNIIFKIADNQGLLLIDIKDLLSILNYINLNKDKYTAEYGAIPSQSISAILRKITNLETLGLSYLFGEPAINLKDMSQKDDRGFGYINLITAKKLYNYPLVYSVFMFYLLSELYENLPEVGNLEYPKIVMFFDEAHLIFDNCSKFLISRFTQIIRLIRSKGVGIYFVTQNPTDIPDEILSQLGNKILHQVRAYTPKEIKSLKLASEFLRSDGSFDVAKTLTELKSGTALVSLLDEEGSPEYVQNVLISPPRSSFSPMEQEEENNLILRSHLFDKYKNDVDPVSAYEMLKEKVAEKEEVIENEEAKTPKQVRRPATNVDKALDSFVGTVSRTIGRELARNLFGILKKK